ncbi:MAG: glycosyltransferase [Chloroflexi bacterium]|nr:MAG: glycosyltransferase [Chloroflexota bacterium]MBL1194497.1 glycosyltransferase [Chloroflexota bacterium]NOH11785.1 glycosyltransferase family 4 protein [Chloroflexota bacterium]
MRLLFVADGRSPIALNWMRYFVESGHEVHLASTFSCQPELELASLHVTPVAFSGARDGVQQGNAGIRNLIPTGLRTRIRQWLGPMTLPGAAETLQAVFDDVQPELVHAMRIPYEGMLAATANPKAPLLISVWGNDFTLHARSTPWMRQATRRALNRADALHSDTERDLLLASDWGFESTKPGIVLPGAGGIQLDIFYPPDKSPGPTIINPRGLRAYVRNDTFFKAIPLVLKQVPEARFVCPTMQGEPEAENLVMALGIGDAVEMLPKVSRAEMAELFRGARVAVSPSEHDGTPNTLLEGMACGCFPVAGDIASLREWIKDGDNGLLVDPGDPQALAATIVRGLQDDALRQVAQTKNLALVRERAEYGAVMHKAEEFYKHLLA